MKLPSALPAPGTGFWRTVALFAALAPAAEAAVLVSNVDEPRRDASTIQANPSELVPLPWAAQSFTTDGQAYRLDALDAMLGELVGAPTIVAELRADTDGTAPGTVLVTLGLVGAPGSGAPALATLVPTATTTLAAGTTYWLVLGALGEGSYAWEYAEGNAFSGPGSLGSFNYSDDQGLSWIALGSDNPFKLTVQVSAVPVPGVTLLFCAGMAGLLARRRATQRAGAGSAR